MSVVLATYDRADVLRDAMDSILNQTLEDFEFLIINDGSTDNTQEILEDYAKRDARIRLLSQENGGLSRARNLGVRHAKSKYIAFMDDDDLSLPNRLMAQYDFLERSPGIFSCNCHFFFGDWETGKRHLKEGDPLPPQKIIKPHVENNHLNDKDRKEALKKLPPVPFGLSTMTMIDKSAFIASGGFRSFFKIYEDWDLALRFEEKYRMGVVPECLFVYTEPNTDRTDNLSTKDQVLGVKYLLAAYISSWHRRNTQDPIEEGKTLEEVLHMANVLPSQLRSDLAWGYFWQYIFPMLTHSAKEVIALMEVLAAIDKKAPWRWLYSQKRLIFPVLLRKGKIIDLYRLLMYALLKSFRSRNTK